MKPSTVPLAGEIVVTPFLDVLLVLIITFLAAMNVRKALDVQLSQSCPGTCVSNASAIVLEVLADGSYALNKQPVANQQLSSTLHATYDRRPDKILQVAGRADATYAQVLAAMDVARGAGVLVIGVPPGDRPPTRP